MPRLPDAPARKDSAHATVLHRLVDSAWTERVSGDEGRPPTREGP